MPRHRQAPATGRYRLLRKRRGEKRPQVRRAHLPHQQQAGVGLREFHRGIQPLHEQPRRQLQGKALQPAVQHERVLPDVGRADPGRSAGENRGTEGRGARRPERPRAREPRRTGAHARGQGHLREAHQGIHREAVGPQLQGPAGVHHQAAPGAPRVRQQLLQRQVPGHPRRRLQQAHRRPARRCRDPHGRGLLCRIQGQLARDCRQARLYGRPRRIFRLQARQARLAHGQFQDSHRRYPELPGLRRRQLHLARPALHAHHRAQTF